jgi:uncharacterized protein
MTKPQKNKAMENRRDWIDQIGAFLGEYTRANPGYSPLALAQILTEKFLISPDQANQLAGIIDNELGPSKLCLTAMELNLTFNCNLACQYCFVRRKSAHDRMTAATAGKAIDLLLKRAAVPEVTITLIGGEPLLEMALIEEIVPVAAEAARRSSLHINWAITTNGTLIDEKALKFFARHRIAVLLSIDGGPESHDRYRLTKGGAGTWHKIAGLIPLMKKYQPQLGARMTISPEALDAMREDFRRLVDLGLHNLIIGPAHGPCQWSKEQIAKYGLNLVAILHDYHELINRGLPLFIEEFEQMGEYTGWGCRAGRTSLAVAPNGSVSPCSKLLGLENEDGRWIIGNVNEGIDARLLEPFRNADRQPLHCRHCFLRCGGGCYAVNFEQTGNHFLPSEENCLFWTVRQEVKRIARSLATGAR